LAVVSLQSVPKAKVYGAEASVEFEVINNLNLRADATWLHARYGDNAVFVGLSVNLAGTGYNLNDDPLKVFPNRSAVAMDISGMQMARAPDFTAFAGFDYLIPMGDGGIRLAANAKYTDSYVVSNPSIWGGGPLAAYNARKALDPNALPNNDAILAPPPYADRSNDQPARQGNYVLLNASVTWTDASDHYYVRVWGNNLTDVTYRTHYNPSSKTYSPVGEPRTYGVTLGYKFGP
jgi:iron complex outermembrane receptor protein